jgi:hypothetical protein
MTLKDLLEQAKVTRGVTSGRALADLTQGRENTIDRTQVNQLLAGTYKSVLRPSTIRAIAWLAGVDEAEAFAAANQPVPGPPLARELPPGADYLSGSQRSAVITVIRALLSSSAELEEVMGNAMHPAPIDKTILWQAIVALEAADGGLSPELRMMRNLLAHANAGDVNDYLSSSEGVLALNRLIAEMSNGLRRVVRERQGDEVLAALDDPSDPAGSAHD